MKTIRAGDDPGQVSKPTPAAPPLLLSHTAPGRVVNVAPPRLMAPAVPRVMAPVLPPQAAIKPTPAGNVIVVDTGRLKQVMKGEPYQYNYVFFSNFLGYSG